MAHPTTSMAMPKPGIPAIWSTISRSAVDSTPVVVWSFAADQTRNSPPIVTSRVTLRVTIEFSGGPPFASSRPTCGSLPIMSAIASTFGSVQSDTLILIHSSRTPISIPPAKAARR